MILVTPPIRQALAANAAARLAALSQGLREPDPVPVVRFFNPVGSATWLATEIDNDDILFGLADLGFGCPELGSFALAELTSLRLPFGLGIERDLGFEGRHPLSVYAQAARRAGSLVLAGRLLDRAAATLNGRRAMPGSG
jgi:Protein of unknown function (DUF2958)